MRLLLASVAAVAAVLSVAQPAAAQADMPWTRATLPSGTATIELPCDESESLVAEDGEVEIAGCNWAGYEIVLLVMPDSEWTIEGVTDKPFAQTREQLLEDPTTAYLQDTTMGYAPAFYAEGVSAGGKVGTAMADLDAERLLVLLVQSDGSPTAEDSLSQIFARVRGSLEVAPQ